MFCKNCGKEIADNMKFCDGCGAAVEVAADSRQTPPQPEPQVQQPTQSAPPPPPPPQGQYQQQNYQQPAAGASDNTKLFSILAYIGILFVVGLIADPNNQKVKFHVNQGCILFIVEIVLGIAVSILNSILWGIHIYFLGSLLSLAQGVICIGLAIMGIVNAVNDQQKPLPVIGNYTIIK